MSRGTLGHTGGPPILGLQAAPAVTLVTSGARRGFCPHPVAVAWGTPSALEGNNALQKSAEPGSPHAVQKCFHGAQGHYCSQGQHRQGVGRSQQTSVRERSDYNQAALHRSVIENTRKSQAPGRPGPALCVSGRAGSTAFTGYAGYPMVRDQWGAAPGPGLLGW